MKATITMISVLENLKNKWFIIIKKIKKMRAPYLKGMNEFQIFLLKI
jgi:hypothetical protein